MAVPIDHANASISGPTTDPLERYDGPDFEEYCIREAAYLPASRDRSACQSCPLGNLCQAGFEEQVRKVLAGENPSLTECKQFSEESLRQENLLQGLTEQQRRFVLLHVYDEPQGGEHG